MVKAVIFDAFGTLIRPVSPKGPYQKLSRLVPCDSYLLKRHEMMTVDMPFDHFADAVVDKEDRESLAQQLEEELASITPYPDSDETMRVLKSRGMKVGVCSNLAQAYGSKVRQMLGQADEIFLSYEIGHIKPSPEMYGHVVRRFRLEPHECLFIGDNPRADVRGPIAFGMHAFEINRRTDAPRLIDQIDRFMELA